MANAIIIWKTVGSYAQCSKRKSCCIKITFSALIEAICYIGLFGQCFLTLAQCISPVSFLQCILYQRILLMAEFIAIRSPVELKLSHSTRIPWISLILHTRTRRSGTGATQKK